jgi:hypothetical protein
VYMLSGIVTLSNGIFTSNTLSTLVSGQKGAALYVIASEVSLSNVVFQDHSCRGSGCTVFVDQSDVSMLNVNGSNSAATGDGGFMKVQGDR